MYLFLEGPPQVGKSTTLRNALLPHQQAVAGLMVQRLFEGERMCGFRALVVNGVLPALQAPWTGGGAGVFLNVHDGTARPEVLEDAIARAAALCAQPACRLVILDEIGGLELGSGAFMAPLGHILEMGKPCMGVVKAQKNLAHTAARLGLPQDILALNATLHRRLEAGGRVLAVDEDTLDAAKKAADAFVAAALGTGSG